MCTEFKKGINIFVFLLCQVPKDLQQLLVQWNVLGFQVEVQCSCGSELRQLWNQYICVATSSTNMCCYTGTIACEQKLK